jgi:hypothetical protein
MKCARNMIIAQGLELEFWCKAVNTAMYIKNRCPTKAFNSKTPQEAWSGRKPDVSHLRVFGCKAFAYVLDEKRTKLESKSMHCVFCRNLSFGLATKAKGLQECEPRESLGVTSHTPGSVRKCEGVNPHTPKATPTLGDGVSEDSQNFKE